MRNLAVIGLVTVLCVLIGCLGMGGGGGGGGSVGVGPVVPTGVVLSGRAYFAESSYYGGIPVLAKDATGLVLGTTRTDSQGNYYFTDLPAGVYNLFASTGESEIQFFSGAQVIAANPVSIPEKPLIELERVVLDQVTSTSVRLRFEASVSTVAQVEYSTSTGSPNSVSAGSIFSDSHQVNIGGLVPGTRYGFSIRLQSQDGQTLFYPTVYTTTATSGGPTNLAFSINNGDIKTRNLANKLYLSAEGAVQMRVGTSEDLTSQPWESYTTQRDYTFTTGDGTRRVYVQFRDLLGNLSPVVNDSILLQTDNTGYIGVWVNNGEALTNKLDVLLTILYPGASHMQVSDRPDFLNAFWESYVSTRKMKISTGDGPKTVYVRFRGGNANENKSFSATIVLDTAGPEVVMAINNGALKTNQSVVQVSFTYSKQPVEMQIQGNDTFTAATPWVKFANPYRYVLSRTDGEKFIYARFKDSLGNISPVVEGRIVLDSKAPESPSLLINNGDELTKSLSVKLTLDVTGDEGEQLYMMISNNENFSGATVERFSKTKAWILSGYGLQTVYATFFDDASNSTTILVESILVEGVPPASGTVKINDGDPSTESTSVNLTINSESTTKIRIAEHENFSSVADQLFVPNVGVSTMRISNFQLSPQVGEKKIFVRMEDASGSFSVGSDSILLIGPSSYSISTPDTQPLSSFSVSLRPFAIGATQMLITEAYANLGDASLWRPFVYSTAFNLERFLGKHTIYAKYRNNGNVETPVLSLDVVVSEVTPATPTILVNMGDAVTTRSRVQVKVLSSGIYSQMQLSNDGTFYNSAVATIADTMWDITRTEGQKTVYARFLNASTNEAEVVYDLITARGPSSATISTTDVQPLNKNWVQLNLFADEAVDMIVTEDPAVKSLNSGWIPYQTSLVFPLGDKVGKRTIFAKYRNAATDWIESLPVQLDVTVNASAPTGNAAVFRATAAADSARVSEVVQASMPIYLHFEITDSKTASIAWKIVPGGAAVPNPSDMKIEVVPVAPIGLNQADFGGYGIFNLYYQFSDGAGNKSGIGVSSIRLIDPSQVVTPTTGRVTINNGDAVSESSRLAVNLYSGNASKVRVSSIESFSLEPDISYIADPNGMNITFDMSPNTAGLKTVFARFESASGSFGFASDTITLIGPTNATMTVLDPQPLNKKWVELSLYAEKASRMLISQSLASFSTPSLYWEPYAFRKVLNLEDRIGSQTIYCKFYNSTTTWVETEMLQAAVRVNSIAPTGNNAAFRVAVSSASALVTEISPASMPFYLHFDIKDSMSATVSYRLVRADAAVPTTLTDYSLPILPVRLNPEDFPGYGTFNLYYSFIDGVGNRTPVQIVSVKILEPEGGYSPVNGTVKINDGDQFTDRREVSLNLYSATATKIKVSQSETFSSVTEENYVANAAGGAMIKSGFLLTPDIGTRTVYVRFEDASGSFVVVSDYINLVGPSSYSISTPDTLPLSTYTINLRPFAQNANEMIITEDYAQITNGTGWASFSFQFAFPMQIADGQHTIYAKYRNAGFVETPIMTLEVEAYGIPPATPTLAINDGDISATDRKVSLLLFSEKGIRFRLSETVSFASVPDENYIAGPDGKMIRPDYYLTPELGEKTLHVRYEDADGKFTYASDTVTLLGPASYTLTTNDSLPLSTYTVNLRPFAFGANEMLITEDFAQLASAALWASFSYSLNFPLAKIDGKHTVYAKYRNAGHVETPVISLDLNVAVAPPASPSIMLNGGDSFTNSSAVTVNVTTSADYSSVVRLSEDGDFFSVTDTAAVDQPFIFTDKLPGTKTVYARFKHNTRNEYITVSDTILARGPASATISTFDAQPMNKNWVALELYTVGAARMLITDSIASFSSPSLYWEPYATQKIYSLGDKKGDRALYCKFYNSATNWIETDAVSLNVSVIASSPNGNLATLRQTVAPTSDAIAQVPVGSLPIYLHFTINDANTSTASYQIASGGSPIPTVFKKTSLPVAPIVLDQADFAGNGTFNVYYKFSDGVGNETPLNIVSVKVLGPSLKISPQSAGPFYSAQTQQFLATLENVEGTVRWTASPSTDPTKYGSININTGLYTAPSNITATATVTIRGELLGNPSVYDEIDIDLLTQVEVAVSPTSYKISKGEVATITVRFVNSNQIGVVNISDALGGTATMTAHPGPFVPPTDTLASLTYYAPSSVPTNNPVALRIVSSEDPSKQETIFFEINDGPYVSLSPSSTTLRLFDGSAYFAAESSSKTADLQWRLPDGGTFSDGTTATRTTTTDGRHTIRVFAPAAGGPTIRLGAYFIEGATQYGATSTISLTPRVSITVTPKLKNLYVADTAGLTFQATVSNTTNNLVYWEFKNASDTDWVRADNYVNAFNGTLDTSGIDAVYLPPDTFPASQTVDVKMINIRAISQDDATAIAVASITLLEALKVRIHDGFNSAAPDVTDSSVNVTLEVGKRQFYAAVGPVTDPTVNTSVTWYVQNIAGGNTTYGTVDSTGKFTAPDTAPQAAVTLKAVSVSKPTAFAETTINLLDFWVPRSDNLKSVTNATHSIYSLQIDPTTAAGVARILFAGTNGNGAYRSTVAPSGSDYDWNTISWSGITNLNTNLVGQGGQYVINDIAMSIQNPARLVVATNNGLYLINGGVATQISVPARIIPGGASNYGAFTQVFSSVAIDPTNDNYLYAAGKDQGVLRFVWNSGTTDYDYDGTLYDDLETRHSIVYVDRVWTAPNASAPSSLTCQEPMLAVDASGTMSFNTIEINPQNPNILYVGYTNFLVSRNPDVFVNGYMTIYNIRTDDFFTYYTDNYAYTGNWSWSGGDPVERYVFPGTLVGAIPASLTKSITRKFFTGSILYRHDTGPSIIHEIKVDPNTATTIWVGKNDGIYRTTNDGSTFTSLGNYTNVRSIFIDPINTINVYIGTESGLYRTRDAGATWKQIKSGLEGHTTINALGLTPGGVGTRRIFCGTTNGIFMGRTTLDLE